MSIIITSTTDSQANMQAAMGGKASEQAPAKEAAPAPTESTDEQKESEASGATENEPKEEATDESDDPESLISKEDDGEEDDAANKGKPKKKGGFQRRIDKLNARNTAAQQEIEYWKQQALKGAQASGDPDPKPEQTPKSQDGKPDPDKFESYTAYSEALADWKAEQKIQEYEQRQHKKQLEQTQASAEKAHFDRVKSFAEKHADFQDVLAEVDDVPLAPTFAEILKASESGPEIIYRLAKEREELERINKLPPLALAREIGKLEYLISSASKSSSKEPQKKTTQAPKPINPVGTKGNQTEKSIYDATLSQKEYEALRAKQRSA